MRNLFRFLIHATLARWSGLHLVICSGLRRIVYAIVLAIVFAAASTVLGQSTEQNLPTPVLSNEVTGKIKALDLGDPRLTRHFYAFEANPGDLLITVDSTNLNGDLDIFTAVTLRPLMKTTLYASSQAPEVTKSVYLRTHQILILRVEARTPSDEPGSYHIRFGGTFAQFSGGIPVAEPSTAESEETEKAGANRLSSVGATIPRPPTEPVAETAEPKPSPSPEKSAEKPAEETPTAKKTTSTTSRRNTSRPPARRTTRPAPAKSTAAKRPEPAKPTETEKTEISKPVEEKPAEEKPAAEKPLVTEKPVETNPPARKAKPQEVALPGARLIVEQKNGDKIDRPMSTVRRVIVEGNMIVIVMKNGRIDRIPMSDVARMAIEPE